MKTIHDPSRRRALARLGIALSAPWASALPRAAGAEIPLPGNSIYQLHPALLDQDGRPFDLASLRGNPVLASMFYSSCEMVCPMIFETIRQTVDALPAAGRRRIRVLMASFDPARDSVEVLKRTAKAHGCDDRWTLVRADEVDTRKLAALLGVQYRRLASGEFNHSTSIELLDGEGRIVARSGKLGAIDPQLMQPLKKELERRA
ncbi:MAG TPA: SCO family protein [Burkholderiaceae bacterium]|nr:SCO family protein [Burkholderiaceae bacterium]